MVFKKVMAGFVGVLLIACLGQALFLCHLRNEEPSKKNTESSSAHALAASEPDMSWKQAKADLPVSTWSAPAGAHDQRKTDYKREPSISLSAPLFSEGDAKDKSAKLSAPYGEAPGQLASRDGSLQELPPLLPNISAVALGAPVENLAPHQENAASPMPAAPNPAEGIAALSHSKESGMSTLEPSKRAAPIPTAIPFPANPPANLPGASKEPAPTAGKGSQAEPPPFGFDPFPVVKKEDPAATFAQLHKQLAELMSPEELQQAVLRATVQLEARKKLKEKERKEQAALTALEKARLALKQVSFEFPDTDAGKKASEFLKTLEPKEDKTPGFPGLSPPKPGALDGSLLPPVSFQDISSEKKAAIKISSASATPR